MTDALSYKDYIGITICIMIVWAAVQVSLIEV